MQSSPSSPSLPVASVSPDEVSSTERLSILVVEAEPALAVTLVRALEEGELGQVELCGDVETASERVRIEGACVIVLALPRPRDGDLFVSLGRLRRSSVTRRLPILVVNEGRGRGDRERAFAEGASEYVETPLLEAELRARVSTLCRAAVAERDRDRVAIENEALRTRLAEVTTRLRAVGEVDAETGLPGRRRLYEFLQAEWRRARRNGSPLSLVLVDVGEGLAKDPRLPQVAASLRGVLRRGGDLLARHGERRFAAVLPEVHPEGAAVVSESLRRAVHATDPAAKVTIGVVTLRPQEAAEDSPDALLTQAEQTLGRALTVR